MDSQIFPRNGLCYLILESRSSAAILQKAYEIEPNPEWEYLFAQTEWEPYQEQSPIVLQVREDSDLYRWARQGLQNDELSGLILDSSQGLRAVTDWARQRLSVQFDGGRRGLLRFYDPRIWHGLAPSAKGQDNVITSVTYWYGETGHERWVTSDNPDPVTMGATPTLEPEQWRALNSAPV
ncbi:MAG: DUF4123 domain-containing protein [Marinobacter sp.]|uniref:DUF4123 domain-containing protein n=1 Tax=Marinobacter sp. TaxID=50741 RepID=UPI00299D0797|nr:DUF4123 domain-containing protein [Marinobacter sp.]MDX1757342.1 DUF4123 domain-containing protein [Marinobacter sp.]